MHIISPPREEVQELAMKPPQAHEACEGRQHQRVGASLLVVQRLRQDLQRNEKLASKIPRALLQRAPQRPHRRGEDEPFERLRDWPTPRQKATAVRLWPDAEAGRDSGA